MKSYRRRGVMLTLVVIVMGIVGGLLTLLMTSSVGLLHERQVNRVRATADAIADSGAAYARVHGADWATSRPAAPIDLNVAELLPEHCAGSARLQFPQGSPRLCRLEVTVCNTSVHAEREVEIPLASAR